MYAAFVRPQCSGDGNRLLSGGGRDWHPLSPYHRLRLLGMPLRYVLLCIFPSAQTFIVAVADLNVICRFPKIGFQGTVQQLFSLDSPTHQSTGTFFYGEQGIGGYNFHRFGCLLKRGLPAVILQLWEFIVMIRKLFLGNFEALLCPRRGFLQRGIYIEAKFPTLIRSEGTSSRFPSDKWRSPLRTAFSVAYHS